MTLLWRNFSGCVFANSKLRLFINFYFWSECRWRVQPAAARFNKMHRALRAFHVSLNDASTRTGHKWVKRNNGHLLTLQIWTPWKFMSGERRTKLFLNLYSKPKTVSELKVALGQLREYLRCVEWHSEHFSVLVFALTMFALSYLVATTFDNVSNDKLPWLKAA